MQQTLVRRLVPLAWALAGVVAVLLALSWGALKIQVALAGFLNGESVWSKAQKQAVIDLDAYADSGEAENLKRFRRDFAILADYRYVRDAAQRPQYDYDKITRILRADNAMPEALPLLIFMLRHMQNAPNIREALVDWRATDSSVDQLDRIAKEMESAYASGPVAPAVVARQRNEISRINTYIEPLSNRFSKDMVHGAVWVSHLLFGILVAAGVFAVVLWLMLARRILIGLHGSEERFRLLFDSAADAILMVDDASGVILQSNRRAAIWTGLGKEQLLGRNYLELFEDERTQLGRNGRVHMLRNPKGEARPVEVSSSVVHWGDDLKVRQEILRDLTERMDMARERRIASEAMASVAEGLIIADARRRVLTVNAAHQRLTGYEALDVEGTVFDEYRRDADGNPLPESVWADVERDGHWSGEVQARRRDGSVYPELLSISAIRGHDGKVEHYVAVCTDITDSKAAQRHLQYMASHDALTGLVNRSEFERRVSEAIAECNRRNESAAVVFVDLDNFKVVNDSYSHAIGDRLLMVVAERILRHLPKGAVAARIGGDEFTILVGHLRDREDVALLGEQLIQSLSKPFAVEGYEIVLGASIGIAAYPLDGKDATTLLTNADAAMYSAKQEERNTVRFYTPRMRADANRRLLLLTDLRRALQENQFRLMFQPSMYFKDNRLAGAEALLRWEHPERGRIMPGEFVPIAETLGLIRHIDEWVLNSVCQQIASWTHSGINVHRIAVNVSASWFSHPDFVQHLTRAIRHHNVDPSRIMLEVTESTILQLGEDTRRTMSALHELGVAVAIDDFGTGYSSLAYLKLPAVTYLKIDRSFVDELPDSAEDASIVQAMMVMAHSLGLAVIAEGVETEQQHEFLRLAGCQEGQGYLYSRPIPAEEIEPLLRRERRREPRSLKLVPPPVTDS